MSIYRCSVHSLSVHFRVPRTPRGSASGKASACRFSLLGREHVRDVLTRLIDQVNPLVRDLELGGFFSPRPQQALPFVFFCVRFSHLYSFICCALIDNRRNFVETPLETFHLIVIRSAKWMNRTARRSLLRWSSLILCCVCASRGHQECGVLSLGYELHALPRYQTHVFFPPPSRALIEKPSIAMSSRLMYACKFPSHCRLPNAEENVIPFRLRSFFADAYACMISIMLV